MQEVEAICDRVIIIKNGKIVADDVLRNLTNKQTANKITIELQEAIDTILFTGLQSKKLTATKWEFTTNNADMTRKQLMEIVLANNLNIVSLTNESNTNLEDVFRNLTANK